MSYQSKESGFTFVEMMVTIGVLTLILGVIVYGQSFYTERISLTNDADQMSLVVNQAQAYSIGSKGSEVDGSYDFYKPYGFAINLDVDGMVLPPSSNSYYFFADGNTNALYDDSDTCDSGSECVEKISLKNNNNITAICVIESAAAVMRCDIGRVDVVFNRPNTEAIISLYDLAGVPLALDVSRLILKLESQSGHSLFVNVFENGAASIESVAGGKCDADYDSDIDQDDLWVIRYANGQLATDASDPRDGNNDTHINVADVRFCQLRLNTIPQ